MSSSLLQKAIMAGGADNLTKSLCENFNLTESEVGKVIEELRFNWKISGRPEQQEPLGDWVYWFILAGRGFGKTRAGAEFVRDNVEKRYAKRIALVGRTTADIRDTLIEGESGLLNISPKSFMPVYEPSKRRIRWPNGAIATTYSGDEPDQLRGPQHDLAWVDELASYKYPEKTWDNLIFGLRIGFRPRCCITTTPRPIKIIKDLVKDKNTIVTGGSTYDNKANLSPVFFDNMLKKYEGTRIGRQELLAEILEDNPNALFTRDNIEYNRINSINRDKLISINVGIDPAVTSKEGSDDTGIIVSGRTKTDFYVLADYTCHTTPEKWAKRAIDAYYEFQANKIVAEVNNGGDLVKAVLKNVDSTVPVKIVRASRGKQLRAEPLSSIYEQNRVHHVGCFPHLEDEMCTWSPDVSSESPDRLDALVWSCWDMLRAGHIRVSSY